MYNNVTVTVIYQFITERYMDIINHITRDKPKKKKILFSYTKYIRKYNIYINFARFFDSRTFADPSTSINQSYISCFL